MTRPLAPLLAMLLAGCGAPSAETGAEPPEPPVVRRGPPVPVEPRSMTAPTLARWMADPADRVRVLTFWATWCEPCIAEMPVIKELAQRHPDVDVVLVNVDHHTVQAPRVAQLRRNLGIEHLPSVLLDAADPNADLRAHVPGWPEQIPWTIVIARDGHVVAHFTEAVRGPEVEAAVAMASTRGAGPG
jgi:thiol-disulfide isomerase/thioredoxin